MLKSSGFKLCGSIENDDISLFSESSKTIIFCRAVLSSSTLIGFKRMLTLLPVLVVFILGQKYIVGGVAAGSVKG